MREPREPFAADAGEINESKPKRRLCGGERHGSMRETWLYVKGQGFDCVSTGDICKCFREKVK